jgi:hypothetical protein
VKHLLVPFLALSLVSLPAVAAERLAVRLKHGGALCAAEAERVLDQAEQVGRELTGLEVTRVPEGLLSGRCGAQDACLRATAAEARTEHVLVLGVVPRRQGVLDVDVAWVDTVRGSVAKRPVLGVPAAGLAKELRPALPCLPRTATWVVGSNSTPDVEGVLRQVKRVEVLVQPATSTGGFRADFQPDFGLP